MDDKKEHVAWIESGKSDLLDFKSNYDRKDYHRSLFFLQQASEKLAKATMISLSFSSSSGLTHLGSTFGIPVKTPKSYGHDWRRNFIIQLDRMTKGPFMKPFLESFRDQGLKNPQTTTYNAKMVEDLKEPNSEVIEGIVVYCNDLIDRPKTENFKNEINNRIEKVRPTIDALLKMAKGKVDGEAIIQEVVSMIGKVFSLDALLIMSTLLSPFNEMRYPNEKNVDAFIPHLMSIYEVLEKNVRAIE